MAFQQSTGRRWAIAGAVFAGGALGTAARAGVEQLFATATPWPTLAVNVVGSFLLGVMIETQLLAHLRVRHIVRLAVSSGFLGGFTTYSTFVGEVAHFWQSGAIGLALGYAAVSLVAGVAAAGAGIALARRRPARRAAAPAGQGAGNGGAA